MAGVKAIKTGCKGRAKSTSTDGGSSPSISPRVVTDELMTLLRRGNASAMKRWLKSGNDVNQILHAPQLDELWVYAAPTAAPAAAAAAAPPPAPRPSGHWPLILLACAVSSAGVVEALLKVGADANARNMYGLTALVAAVQNDGLTATEKLAVAKLLHRHGFSLFGASCEALGERATAATALLHQLAVADEETRAAAGPLLDWLLQHEPLPAPADQQLFQHLCCSLALEPSALQQWLPLLQRRTAYVLGSPAFAELVVGVVAAAHQLREARASAAAQAAAAAPPPPPSSSLSTSAGSFSALDVEYGNSSKHAMGGKGSLGQGQHEGQHQEEHRRKPELPPRKSSAAAVPAAAAAATASPLFQPASKHGDGGGGGGSGSGGSNTVELGHLSTGAIDVRTDASGCGSSSGYGGSSGPSSPVGGSAVRGPSVVSSSMKGGVAGGAVRPASASVTVAARERSTAADRSRQAQNARSRAAAAAAAVARASAAAAAAVAAAAEEQEAEAAGGGRGDETVVLRAFLECGLNPNAPMCADGLLPMQRFLEKPELLAVLLEGGMDPRVKAGAAPLDLTFLHSYALIGRFQSASEVSVQACALLLSRDPGLLWVRCAGLTAFDLALSHANLAMADYLARVMRPEQQEAVRQLQKRMTSFGAASAAADGSRGDGTAAARVDDEYGADAVITPAAAGVDADDNVARRVWDPASLAAADAAVAAAAACSPITVTGQDSEVASSYRLLCLALQRQELWSNDLSGLMRQVPWMDIRQILTLLDVLNSPNLFNVVTFLEHCRTFAQRVILQVLQLGAEGHDLMLTVVPPPAVASAMAFLRANPDNLWLQSVAKYFPPLVDAMVAAEDTQALMLVAPQRLLERAAEVSVLPPDLVQAACESARAAMLLENGFHSPRPQLDDLEGPLRKFAAAGYHRLLLRLLLALPAASKQVWHDIHVMAYLPEVCTEVALQLCASPALTTVVTEALAVVQACMSGRTASKVLRAATAATAGSSAAPAIPPPLTSEDDVVASYDDAVQAVVAHLAAHLSGIPPMVPSPPPRSESTSSPVDEQPLAAAAANEVAVPAVRDQQPGQSISNCASSTCSRSSSSVARTVAYTSDGGSSSGSSSGGSSGSSSGSAASTGQCSPARTASPPPGDSTPAMAADVVQSMSAVPAEDGAAGAATAAGMSYPSELFYLEDVVVEQTDLLQSLYTLMAVCSLCSHLLCPDFGLAMCSREFRTRMTGIPDTTVDELGAKHGGAGGSATAAANAAAAAQPTPSPKVMSTSSAAAATAAAILAAYPRSGSLSLDQLYAQLLGNMSLGVEQKELVESRREFLKQVLAMDSTWKALQGGPVAAPAPAPAPDGAGDDDTPAEPAAARHMVASAQVDTAATANVATGEVRSTAQSQSVSTPTMVPRRDLQDPGRVAAAQRAVLSHPVIWPAVQAVAALPAAPGLRPGVRVFWDDDNTPIYVLMSLAARRAVETAIGLQQQQEL